MSCFHLWQVQYVGHDLNGCVFCCFQNDSHRFVLMSDLKFHYCSGTMVQLHSAMSTVSSVCEVVHGACSRVTKSNIMNKGKFAFSFVLVSPELTAYI